MTDPKILLGLQAAEVSLVKRGANKKKRFPIFKEESMDKEMQEILKAVLETEIDEEADLQEVLAKAEVSEKAMAAIKSALRILAAYKDELPKNAIDMLASAAGYPKPKAMDEDEKYPKPKAAPKVKKEEKEVDEVKKENTSEMEVVMKAQAAELEALKTQNAEITKALKEERDTRELERWVEKAKTELSHFPGKSSEDLGKLLKSLHDVNPELAKEQYEQMKAASDALRESNILKEAGSVSFGKAGSAWDKIEKMATGIVEKSEELNMSKEKAIARVLKMRPDLYESYLEENPAQTRPMAS